MSMVARRKEHDEEEAEATTIIIIIIILGGASQTGCYREGQCSAGPGVSPQRTPHTV